MANVSHSTLTDPYLHEPKGAGAAAAGSVYVSDGAGSGSWTTPNPHGGWRYNAIGTGTTFTAPTGYTLMNVAGVVSDGSHLFTTNGAGRLTYTGTGAAHLHFVCDLSFKHSSGSGQDCYFAFYKNGSIVTSGANNEMVSSADSGNYQHIAIHGDTTAAQNDYFEIYLKTATGNIVVHAAYMFSMGMPDV